MSSLALLGTSPTLPAIVAAAGEHASMRFLEFFAANIRNPHTRRAYARAADEFLAWCAAAPAGQHRAGPRKAHRRMPRGSDDENFRSAMSECLVAWYLAGRLRLRFNPGLRVGPGIRSNSSSNFPTATSILK
jgi:hypothetical protein